MKRLIIILLLIATASSLTYAQGITFEKGLTWEQILQQAKTEHKYIFIDCYATWCGPCKWMEKEIYPQKEVGDVYNKDIISIKLQMDKTPSDNDTVKGNYDLADMLATNYTVNAYPTFLFLDPDGNPASKSVGAKDAKGFIQLAIDAQNPEKQYYRVLKNFRPNTLDTAEEKGLAYAMQSLNKELAAKIAFDYLNRIPSAQLTTNDHMDLIKSFRHNQQVMAIAKSYINSIPESALYTKPNITFVAAFSETPADKTGFDLFYYHGKKVDAIMGQHGFSTGPVRGMIDNAEIQPIVKEAKIRHVTPNFDSLQTIIAIKYSGIIAKSVVIGAKMGWYKDWVNQPGGDQYWPQYITARIAQVEDLRLDTVKADADFLNNFSCQIFQHGSDKAQLRQGARWMKEITDNNPKNSAYTDTYACLLYKAGEKDAAIAEEKRMSEIAKANKDTSEIEWAERTIVRMKNDEQLWNEKEYQ